MDDNAAITACKNGQPAAFRHLVERYQGRAMGHAIGILGNRDDAQDAVQEAFVDAYRALFRFDRKRSFYPWFYVILRNRCHKRLARRQREPVSLTDEAILQAEQDPDPDREALERALRSISAADRELLTLKYLDGHGCCELAKLLSIPEGTVMSRLYSARQRLRETLLSNPNFRPKQESRHEF